MTYLFANDAKTTLASSISSSATSLTVAAGAGALFPTPTGGNIFALTLKDASTGNTTEIMHCTARAGDVLTVVRGQEGTTALNWAAGDFVGNLLTAAVAAAFFQGASTNLAWVVVGGFTDADMASAVATINASANGGVLYLPPGTWTNLPGGYVFTKPVTMIGCGCADDNMGGALTAVQCNSATANLFEFNADPWQVRDVHLTNTAGSTPTAGCGIYSSVGNGHRLNRVTVNGFWDNIQIDNGAEWFWGQGVSFGAVNYAAYIRNIALPDGGDQDICQFQFIANTHSGGSAIRYESGGGLRLTSVKVNGRGGATFATGLDVSMANGAATVDLLGSNCSIENVSGSPIKFRNTGTGTLNNVKISGFELAEYSTTLPPIDIVASATGVFDRLIVTDIVFGNSSSSVSAINIQNIDNVWIGPCVQNNHPQLVTATSVTNYRNANAPFGIGVLTDASTILMDCANHQNFNLTLGGNHTLALPTNCAPGPAGNIRVHTGGNTLSFASGWKFSGGTAPVLASGANMLTYQYDDVDGTFWIAATSGAFS